MNKSPQYNQQAEPEKRRSEVEGVYVFIKTWKLDF